MKRKYIVKKCWRCVGYDGDVFFRDTLRTASRDNDHNSPEEVYSVRKDGKVIADCYSAEDARKVRDALNAAAA